MHRARLLKIGELWLFAAVYASALRRPGCVQRFTVGPENTGRMACKPSQTEFLWNGHRIAKRPSCTTQMPCGALKRGRD